MILLHFCFCHVERNMSAAFMMQRQIHRNKRYNSTLLYGKLSGPFSCLFLVFLNLSLFGPISVYLILSLGFKPLKRFYVLIISHLVPVGYRLPPCELLFFIVSITPGSIHLVANPELNLLVLST